VVELIYVGVVTLFARRSGDEDVVEALKEETQAG
jgi:hypothetical protein